MTNTDLPPLLESLLQPAAHDHPADAVQLIETHISWILLTGTYAYKFKKPVQLGFVDFRTLARRRHFCHEELRLNQRTAAAWYCDVVAVTGSPEEPRFCRDAAESTPEHANVLDYAVKMKQWPVDAVLDVLVQQDRLTLEQADAIGAAIAGFHQTAAKMPDECPIKDADFGTPAQVSEMLLQNAGELQEQLNELAECSPGQSQEQIAVNQRLTAELVGWLQKRCERQASLFQQRLDDGMVRECHGDLHLGNMFWHEGHVVPFDALEFNPEFRWGDVISELAFTLMDLQHHHHFVHVHRVRDVYLQHTGDYAGVALLPLYSVYRAMIRAKVAAICAHQHFAHDTSVPTDDLRDLTAHLLLARSFTQPPPAQLLITHGLSGSGKTTGSQKWVDQTGTIRIRSDVERQRLQTDEPEDLYAPANIERTYARLEELADEILAAGYSVLVDATFVKQSQRERFYALADRRSVDCNILHFDAPPEVLKQRIRERMSAGNDASEATWAVLEHQLNTCEPLTPAERTRIVTAM